MKKNNIERKQYTEWEIMEQVAGLVRAYHADLERDEKRYGRRCYETFGEWKKLNQSNPVAKKNYPDNEYLLVISAYKKYFDKICDESKENLYQLDF